MEQIVVSIVFANFSNEWCELHGNGFCNAAKPWLSTLRESSSIFFYLNCEEQKKNGYEYININVLLCFILAKMGPAEIWKTAAYPQDQQC